MAIKHGIQYGKNYFENLEQGEFLSSWGLMKACWQEDILYGLSLPDADQPLRSLPPPGGFLSNLAYEIEEYFLGHRKEFSIPYQIPAQPEFYSRIWQECAKIPYGETLSYGELAARCGNPQAAQAVGGAMAHNPLPLFVPCHRVVGAGSALGGFSGTKEGPALELKKRLLILEGAKL